MQEFSILFVYISQEGSELKFLNINIIKIEHDISIDQKNHITKKIFQQYWGKKIKDEVKFWKSHFPVGT